MSAAREARSKLERRGALLAEREERPDAALLARLGVRPHPRLGLVQPDYVREPDDDEQVPADARGGFYCQGLDNWVPADDGTAPVPELAKRTSWTAAELMSIDWPEPRWAVPGLVAEGLTLLAGAPKLGKSWLALCLALSIATGGKALGKVDVTPGDVLYLALEDNGRRLTSRLRAVLGPDQAPERLRLAIQCEPIAEGGAARIGAWLDRTPDARLVIVDVFTKVRGRTSEKANRYDADYQAMSALKALADAHEVAMIVVHHTRKADGVDFLDAVSGTQGLAGAADAVMVLTRSRGSAGAVLKITGRDVEEAEHALNFDAPTGTWKLLDGPAADYDVSGERRRILAAVRAEPGLGPKQIADASGVGYGTVKHLVRKMVDAGQLDTDGEGHYLDPVHSVHSVHHDGIGAGHGPGDSERPTSERSPFTEPLTCDNTPTVNEVNTVNGDGEGVDQ